LFAWPDNTSRNGGGAGGGGGSGWFGSDVGSEVVEGGEVVAGATEQGLYMVEDWTAPPPYLPETELIDLMDANGIGTVCGVHTSYSHAHRDGISFNLLRQTETASSSTQLSTL
jgi:hypothetical protein